MNIAYLLDVENTLYRPVTDYTILNKKFNEKERTVAIDWLYKISKKYYDGDLDIFCYAVTLFDIYCSISQKYKFHFVGIICLHISSRCLSKNSSTKMGLYDLTYETNGKYSLEECRNARSVIFQSLGGYLLRSSPIFFVSKKNKQLTALICFKSSLMIYKPSEIAKTIEYLSSGKKTGGIICENILEFLDFPPELKYAKKLLAHTKDIHKNCVDDVIINNKIYPNEGINVNYVPKNYKEYTKLGIVGTGAGGDILKYKKNNILYAVKREDDSISDYNGNFMTEIAILKLLKGSKFIVSIEDFIFVGSKCFIFLEYGQFNLKDATDKSLITGLGKPRKFAEVAPHILDILESLKLCHYNDVIHKDIKPENFVWFGKNFKLIDFGISIPYASSRESKDTIGTPLYMAPELFFEDDKFNYKVDIWAVGMLFYFVATKNYLFPDPKTEKIIKILFRFFGTPTEDTWPGVTKFIGWPTGTRVHQFNEQFFRKKLGNKGYYDLIIPCFVMNPQNRASAEELIQIVNKILL
jgi:hypothetical protein